MEVITRRRIPQHQSIMRVIGRQTPRGIAWHVRRNVQRAGGTAMHILWMLIIGLVVGALAKLIMPGKDPGGIIVTMLIGVAGALIAGFLGRAAGWYREGESSGFIASLVGALLLLGIYRLVVGRRAVHA
ncbi:MAG TPA: GlsB/YeaQ/YmgE family stress response membrane protein [Kofleriaceae bacterium]|nr:GlsB/YeaQ/YmgE family stress response membrane protein [Kofleriaceae bacterium]